MADYYVPTIRKATYEAPATKYRVLVRFDLTGTAVDENDPIPGQEDSLSRWLWDDSDTPTTQIAAVKAELDDDYTYLKGLT